MKNTVKWAFPVPVHPALIAVWAALVAAAHMIPTIPMMGTGSNFSLTAALGPLSGIFFGPIAGALCSAAGGFIGSLIAPHTAWMGPLTFTIGTTTAFTAGCIAWGRWPLIRLNASGHFIVNGGIIVYLVGTILWFTQEIGRNTPLLPLVYYGTGFIALIVGSILAGTLLTGKTKALKLLGVWLCAYGGMVGGATLGNFFSLIKYQMPREVWLGLTFISPLERTVFSAGAMLIGVPLLIGLPKIGVFVGPQPLEDEPPPQAPVEEIEKE